MQLNHKLVDEVAVHLASNTDDLENYYWNQQYQLVQANVALRQAAKQSNIRFTDLTVFPTLYQSSALTDEERQIETELRHKLEESSPEVRTASQRCDEIAEIINELQFELVRKLTAEGLDLDAIAKRIGISAETVSWQYGPSGCNP